MSEEWKPFTPTWTGKLALRRTFWEWLLRRPRRYKEVPGLEGKYNQSGKTVYFKLRTK